LRLKILEKLRTASFNSEFTGSYKKSVIHLIKWSRDNEKMKYVHRLFIYSVNEYSYGNHDISSKKIILVGKIMGRNHAVCRWWLSVTEGNDVTFIAVYEQEV